jgi:hypothetical protein
MYRLCRGPLPKTKKKKKVKIQKFRQESNTFTIKTCLYMFNDNKVIII